MDYGILILVFIVLIGLVGIWFAYKFLKKKKAIAKAQKNIPQELLDTLDKAEQKLKGGLKEDGTTESPYKILWEIARPKGKREVEEATGVPITTEPTDVDRELSQQPTGRQDIQTRVTTSIDEDKPIVRKSKPSNLRRIISRARGRRSS